MKFTKMQGAGNDFIVLDNLDGHIAHEALPALAKRLCARRLSIGADGLMAVEKPHGDGDIFMDFLNSDGSFGEMCGNGARCICRYCHDMGLSGSRQRIETASGTVTGTRIDKRVYRIRLNNPSVITLRHTLTYDGREYDCSYIELGVPGLPHAVVRFDGLNGISDEQLRPIGRSLRSHPSFPKGANINFWEKLGDNRFLLKTFERGVEDFTLACGTGTGSAAAALCLRGLAGSENVEFKETGGTLFISLTRDGDGVRDIYLTGPTNFVCEGEVLDEDLQTEA